MKISMRNFARLHTLFGFILFSVCVLSPVKAGDSKVVMIILLIVGGITLIMMHLAGEFYLSDDEFRMWDKAGRYMEKSIMAFFFIVWLYSCLTELFDYRHSINFVFYVPMSIGVGIYMRGIAYLKLIDLLEE